jgi:hypothetical protein
VMEVRVKGGLKIRLPAATETTDPLALAAERFAPRNTDSFERWSREKLATWLTPAQKLINDSIVANRYTAIPSCHAAGKSRYSAMKVGHFIDSHPVGSAFVVTTAPTSAQVESVLWRELQRVHTLAKLRGRLTRAGYPQWRIGDELVAFGRRPTEVASFQGIHERFILIVLEEADGIPEPLWIAADTLASSGNAHVLAIGNPDAADSHFARVCKPGSGWNVIHIDGLTTPNFTRAAVQGVLLDGEPYPDLARYMEDHGIPYSDRSVADVPMQVRAEWREVLLNPVWVAERMQRWGIRRFIDEDGTVRWRESALWQSKVRGRAPDEGAEGLIPLSWVEAAIRRWREWESLGSPQAPGRVLYGCDVADSGTDETVMPIRRGPIIESLNRIGVQDTETTAKRLEGRLRTVPNSIACIDSCGIGVGVYNRLRSLKLNVIPFNGASSADGMRDRTGEFTFANKRSAAYWHLRELLDPVNGPNQLALPPDDDLVADLTVPTWKVKTGAVIAIEPKEHLVKRLKRSPDCGDAVVMTMWPDTSHAAKRRIIETTPTADSLDEWTVGEQLETLAEQREQRMRDRQVARQRRVFSYT